MGKYQLDNKGKSAITKYHEKNKPAKFDKKQHLEKIRAEYLKKSKNKQINNRNENIGRLKPPYVFCYSKSSCSNFIVLHIEIYQSRHYK